MAYYLSYVVVSNKSNLRFQHASLAITEQNNINEPAKVICRVGLFSTNQVMLEDKLDLKPGNIASHKTYPITKNELSIFLSRVNKDRGIEKETLKMQDEVNAFLKKYELNKEEIDYILNLRFQEQITKEERIRIRNERIAQFTRLKNVQIPKSEVLKFLSNYFKLKNKFTEQVMIDNKVRTSMPGGPEYNLYRFNCKSYALSVMRDIGVIDHTLSNWGIDMPIWSGELKPLLLEDGKIWKTPIVISKRLEDDILINGSPEEIAKLDVNIRQNEYQNFIEEMESLLKDVALDKITGIDDLRKALAKDTLAKIQEPGKTDGEKLLLCEKHLKEAVEKFSKGLEYGTGVWLVDLIKQALNYLGGSFTLSAQYKAKAIKKILNTTAVIKPAQAKNIKREAKSGLAPGDLHVEPAKTIEPILYTDKAQAHSSPQTFTPEPKPTLKIQAEKDQDFSQKQIESIQKLGEQVQPLVEKWLQQLKILKDQAQQDLKYVDEQIELASAYQAGLTGLIKSLQNQDETSMLPKKQQIVSDLKPELEKRLLELQQWLPKQPLVQDTAKAQPNQQSLDVANKEVMEFQKLVKEVQDVIREWQKYLKDFQDQEQDQEQEQRSQERLDNLKEQFSRSSAYIKVLEDMVDQVQQNPKEVQMILKKTQIVLDMKQELENRLSEFQALQPDNQPPSRSRGIF